MNKASIERCFGAEFTIPSHPMTTSLKNHLRMFISQFSTYRQFKNDREYKQWQKSNPQEAEADLISPATTGPASCGSTSTNYLATASAKAASAGTAPATTGPAATTSATAGPAPATTGPAPHRVKQLTIARYQKLYNCSVLIETGTYLGDMIEAQKDNFSQLISIELSPELHQKAVKRFRDRPHISILQGDSGKVLPSLLSTITQPALFWLDGHYSAGITARGDKECPIFEELTAILTVPTPHPVILIDDARCYTGQGDYPTIPQLKSFVDATRPGYGLEVKNDIIRFTKK